MSKITPSRFAYLLSQFLLPQAQRLERMAAYHGMILSRVRTQYHFKERESDIYLCTYPKSGTTWLQMILFQLTTDGDMDKIQHLTRAIPHYEESGANLNKLPEPRILKTHLKYDHLPDLGKCIYIARNGADVANSYFHHYTGLREYKESFDHFFERFMAGKVAYGSWFKHMKIWSKQIDNPRVLFLYYEDMLQDLEGAVRKIAQFCGIPIDEAQMPRILEGCSFEYMKRNQAKLDLRTIRNWYPIEGASFVREGKAGQGRSALNDAQLARFKEEFNQTQLGQSFGRYAD